MVWNSSLPIGDKPCRFRLAQRFQWVYAYSYVSVLYLWCFLLRFKDLKPQRSALHAPRGCVATKQGHEYHTALSGQFCVRTRSPGWIRDTGDHYQVHILGRLALNGHRRALRLLFPNYSVLALAGAILRFGLAKLSVFEWNSSTANTYTKFGSSEDIGKAISTWSRRPPSPWVLSERSPDTTKVHLFPPNWMWYWSEMCVWCNRSGSQRDCLPRTDGRRGQSHEDSDKV